VPVKTNTHVFEMAWCKLEVAPMQIESRRSKFAAGVIDFAIFLDHSFLYHPACIT